MGRSSARCSHDRSRSRPACLVPTLRVGIPSATLCVVFDLPGGHPEAGTSPLAPGTRSVHDGIPTRSVGTRKGAPGMIEEGKAAVSSSTGGRLSLGRLMFGVAIAALGFSFDSRIALFVYAYVVYPIVFLGIVLTGWRSQDRSRASYLAAARWTRVRRARTGWLASLDRDPHDPHYYSLYGWMCLPYRRMCRRSSSRPVRPGPARLARRLALDPPPANGASTSMTILLAVPARASVAAADDFRDKVAPILESKCVRCHGESAKKGGLALHSAEALKPAARAAPRSSRASPRRRSSSRRSPATSPRCPRAASRSRPTRSRRCEPGSTSGAKWPEGVTLKAAKAAGRSLVGDPAAEAARRPLRPRCGTGIRSTPSSSPA